MVRRWCPFWEPLCSALAATADAAGLVFNRHRLHVFGPNLQQIREPARPMPLKRAISGAAREGRHRANRRRARRGERGAAMSRHVGVKNHAHHARLVAVSKRFADPPCYSPVSPIRSPARGRNAPCWIARGWTRKYLTWHVLSAVDPAILGADSNFCPVIPRLAGAVRR